MRNIWIICRKELRSYFVSPIAYILLAMFAIMAGFFFWVILGGFVRAAIESQMNGQQFPMNINEELIRPLISNIAVIGLFLIPMISMRLFSEEKRSGTIELLATSPVRDAEIIIGKWLASLLLYCSMLFLSAIDFIWLFKYGSPDWKPIAIAFLGLILQAGALLAIGTFISALTRNQIVAGVVTFAICLLLWILQWVSSYDSSLWARVLSYLSVLSHFSSFGKGVLSLADLVFYVSAIFVGLFLTARSLDSLRWRS